MHGAPGRPHPHSDTCPLTPFSFSRALPPGLPSLPHRQANQWPTPRSQAADRFMPDRTPPSLLCRSRVCATRKVPQKRTARRRLCGRARRISDLEALLPEGLLEPTAHQWLRTPHHRLTTRIPNGDAPFNHPSCRSTTPRPCSQGPFSPPTLSPVPGFLSQYPLPPHWRPEKGSTPAAPGWRAQPSAVLSLEPAGQLTAALLLGQMRDPRGLSATLLPMRYA